MNYNKALEYMKFEYNKVLGYQDDSLLQKYQDIAQILKELDYGVEYHIAAIFMDILRDTDAVPSNLLRYSNMEVVEAVRLLEEPKNCEKIKHLLRIKKNTIAFPVKMAEQFYNLTNIEDKTEKEIRDMLHETEDYYLKCAVGTIFYDIMFHALVECRKRAKVY